jgi:hypothetical protein
MPERADIVVCGTGSFAARILFDLAATADVPTCVIVAGRNAGRLAWLVTAARARANMFGRPVSIDPARVDLNNAPEIGELLVTVRPSVVLQAASLQTGAVIAAQGNAWSRLVAEGGLSASAVFQAVLSARVARACQTASPDIRFINCCFPDVANGLIAAMGLPITCGIGNIQILAHAFAGVLGQQTRGRELRLLTHYQNLAAWRQPPGRRAGPNARVWLDGTEIDDVFQRFAAVQLTPEPVIDISGTAGVPLMLALAHKRDWRGHAPGPAGLPGGYPVRATEGRIVLDLPAGMTPDAAISWNVAHEEANGLVVDQDGNVRYTGRLREGLAEHSPELARGFQVRDLETVYGEMRTLRERLVATPQ